jgi:hypothetical protein
MRADAGVVVDARDEQSVRYFNSSPEVIRPVVMMYVRYPLSLPNVEDLLADRGIDISHETVRFWWNRFGPMFAAEIRKKVNGKLCYPSKVGQGGTKAPRKKAARGECGEAR